MILGANQYGKSEIRLVKVVRTPGRHEVRDLTVHVTLEGAFDAASAFYPRAGCDPPLPGFSVLAAGGFSAEAALAALLSGGLPPEDPSTCAVSAPAEMPIDTNPALAVVGQGTPALGGKTTCTPPSGVVYAASGPCADTTPAGTA